MLALGVGNAWGAEYELVTSEPSDWSGEYLVVYNKGCFNGSLTTGFDKSAPVDVTISNNKINLDEKYAMIIGKQGTAYSLKTASGYYIGRESSSSNGMDAGQTWSTKYTINFTWDATKKTVKIAGKGGKCLGLNSTTWRFYAASNTYVNLSLYKKVESGSTETVVSVPTFSVPECTFYSSSLDVELSCATDGATIHYTIDGTTPSETSPTYSGAIAINNTTTIKAIAVKDGLTDSEVATATYTKGETVTSYDIDFETNALEAYVNWDFSNITITTATIEAKAGTYYANTSGKASASIKTKEVIQYPGILTFYTSKESGNITSSSWKVQVSENGTTWTDVTSFDATTGDKGDWTERTADLSDYENVYVQISYSGSTAIRAIDEISLAQGVAPVKYTLTIENPENGTLSVTKGGVSVVSGEQFKAGTSLVVTPTPASGYLFESLTVDGTEVELSEGKYTLTMPENDVTISATFKPNEKPAATLTLSKNGETELLPGNHKQDDVVTLPDFESECSKTFVGWDADENCDHAPTYAPGAEYTLAAETQTLYAVYADSESGEVVTQTLTITDQTTNSTYGNNSFTDNKGGVWSGQSNIPDATHFGLRQNDDNTHMASPVFPNNIINITAKIRNQSKSERKVYLCSNNTTAKPSSGDLGGVNVNGSVTDIEHTFTLNGTFNQFYIYTNGALQFNEIEVTYSSAPTYSNYSTTCAAAPKAEVTPTEVTATAAGVEGKVTVTYENVNTENVAVALFNDEACTEAFTAGWLTASLDGDKNITYTVAATTLYTERKAYIQLTAPEANGTTEPAKVVIPVTQAGKDKLFASLEDLVAADLTAGDEVTVTLNNDVIKEFYIYNSNRAGVVFDVQKDGNDIKIYFNNQTTIVDWAVGGKLSGTLTNVKWTTYSSPWQLAPDYNTWAWANLTYTEPKAVSTVVVSGAPTKTTYVDGEAFNPAGLTVTVNYNDATTEVNPIGVTFAVTPATLVKGQTSVSVTATYNSVNSAAYEVTGLTVNDIPTKTVAEFIAAGGTRCYLEGIVSNITNTTYGNFDLTDASGTIYVYGCLNAEGVSQKFADLGVKNGDKIKVIADEYELYGGTKDEAKNVQYVSHISAASITIADITMEVKEVKTISATVEPAEAVVTYTIKENAANAISLSGNTITALAEGTATITATVAEGATYIGNSVDFTVTVTPESASDEVVILAEYNGNWYALQAAEGTGSNSLAALEVTYFDGILYNVADKESITWTRTVVGNQVTFKNGENYLTGGTGTGLSLANASFEWTYKIEDGQDTYIYEYEDKGSIKSRTFLFYKDGYFKNYATSNAKPTETNYSGYPVVTAPVYATAIEIGGDDNSSVIEANEGQKVNVIVDRAFEAGDEWYTLCVPFNMQASLIGTAYQLSGLVQKGTDYVEVNLAPKNTIEAGKPYLVKPNVTVNKFVVENVTIVNTTGESIAKSIEGLSVTMQGVINGDGTTDGLYWVGNKGYLYNDPASKLGLRTYFNIKTPSGIAPRMRVVAGENVETGVEDLFKTDAPVKVIENGQLIIIRDGVKYNVQGQKL